MYPFVEKKIRYENIILVVDDDQYMRDAIRALIGDMAAVITTASASEALEFYKAYQPDVVFLDVHLPEKSGLEILDEIKAYDGDAFVVMISGDRIKDNLDRARLGGAQGFIVKPFELRNLMKYIAQCRNFFFSDRMVPPEFIQQRAPPA